MSKTGPILICYEGEIRVDLTADSPVSYTHLLDAVSTERPILVKHLSVHFCYLNSLAIEKLGYTAETRVAGGTVCLGADGRPNGILEENASYQAIAKLPATSFDETRKNMLRAVRDYNAQGFTTFMAVSYTHLDVYKRQAHGCGGAR